VGVLLGGQAGADVEELPDALTGHVPHGTSQKRPIRLDNLTNVRYGLGNPGDGIPVDLEIVLATQVVVIHPGNAGCARVDRR
jgi:hypothetical protein